MVSVTVFILVWNVLPAFGAVLKGQWWYKGFVNGANSPKDEPARSMSNLLQCAMDAENSGDDVLTYSNKECRSKVHNEATKKATSKKRSNDRNEVFFLVKTQGKW